MEREWAIFTSICQQLYTNPPFASMYYSKQPLLTQPPLLPMHGKRRSGRPSTAATTGTRPSATIQPCLITTSFVVPTGINRGFGAKRGRVPPLPAANRL